jgi:hypothetical protein
MDSTGKYVASAGDRQIRVFHNIAGEYSCLVLDTFCSKLHCRIKSID